MGQGVRSEGRGGPPVSFHVFLHLGQQLLSLLPWCQLSHWHMLGRLQWKDWSKLQGRPPALTARTTLQNWPARGAAASAMVRQVGNQETSPGTLELMACRIV